MCHLASTLHIRDSQAFPVTKPSTSDQSEPHVLHQKFLNIVRASPHSSPEKGEGGKRARLISVAREGDLHPPSSSHSHGWLSKLLPAVCHPPPPTPPPQRRGEVWTGATEVDGEPRSGPQESSSSSFPSCLGGLHRRACRRVAAGQALDLAVEGEDEQCCRLRGGEERSRRHRL